MGDTPGLMSSMSSVPGPPGLVCLMDALVLTVSLALRPWKGPSQAGAYKYLLSTPHVLRSENPSVNAAGGPSRAAVIRVGGRVANIQAQGTRGAKGQEQMKA